MTEEFSRDFIAGLVRLWRTPTDSVSRRSGTFARHIPPIFPSPSKKII